MMTTTQSAQEKYEKKRVIMRERVEKENERLAAIYKKEILSEGLYVEATLPYLRNVLEYRAYWVKAKEGEKKARWTTDTFKTLSEALASTHGHFKYVMQKEILAFKV